MTTSHPTSTFSMTLLRAVRAPRLAGLLMALGGLGLAGTAQAAGFEQGEMGVRSMARGGAIVVSPGDPSALWLNPGALANVKGLQLQLGVNLTHLQASFERTCGPDDDCGPRAVNRTYGDDSFVVDPAARADTLPAANTRNLGKRNTGSKLGGGPLVNQGGIQPIPTFAVAYGMQFDEHALTVAGGLWAPNNGVTDFSGGNTQTTARYTVLDRDLVEAFYGVGVGYRFGRWIGVGATLQGVSAGTRHRLAMSADTNAAENPGYDIIAELDVMQHAIPSASFGLWSNPIDGIEFGASVQMPRSVKASGPLSIQYNEDLQDLIDSGLVNIAQDNPTATAEFELPLTARAGVKGVFREVAELELDVTYEQWSTYKANKISISGVSIGDNPLPPVLQPKELRDTFSVRLGGTVKLFDEHVWLNGGTFYETGATPNETAALDMIDGDKVGGGLGVSLNWLGARFDVGYNMIHVFDRTIGDESIVYNAHQNPLVAEGRTRVAMGTTKANFHTVMLGVNWAFDETFAPDSTVPSAPIDVNATSFEATPLETVDDTVALD